MGGNVGLVMTEAAAYRTQVRNIIGRLVADLGESWDNQDTAKPAAFYDTHATITLGPAEPIEGRAAIRAAFDRQLGKMRGVIFMVHSFDMSDELAFASGTMSYELLNPDRPATRVTAAFTLTLRTRKGDWMIQSHTIGGPPTLPD